MAFCHETTSDKATSGNTRYQNGALGKLRAGLTMPISNILDSHSKQYDAAQLGLNRWFTTFPAKIRTRVIVACSRAWKRVTKYIVRALFTLPGLSVADPRRRIVRIKDCCRKTTSFPGINEPFLADWYFTIRSPE